jgi:phospho-N-acetylmuramoyl-pentapeptide-transferase
MLFNLLAPHAEYFQLFNLFQYFTFRTGGALMTALFLSFLFGPAIINWLKPQRGAGRPIRTSGAEMHPAKARTPIMGGFLILLGLCLSTLLWADLMNAYVWIMMFTTVGFGAVRFADGYLTLSKRNPQGLPRRAKLAWDIGIVGLAGWFAMNIGDPALATGLAVPFLTSVSVPPDILFVSLAILVMVGALHAVNPTDGLANVPVMMIATGGFGFIAYFAGNTVFANHLQIIFVPGTGELAVFCGALVGASLGFLRRTAAGGRG